MFIETRELPVTAPTRVGKFHELAEAMRRGALVVTPGRLYGGSDPSKGCALCCLATGLRLPVGGRALGKSGGTSRLRLETEYGEKIIDEIEFRYEAWGGRRKHTFAEIADWLCREGGCEHAL